MSSKSNILLIDDDRFIMELVEAAMLTIKADLLFALTAQEGIRLAQEKQPSLILMDLLMPAPSIKGWDAISILKSDSKTAHIPIIVLTAAGNDNIMRAMQAGADDYVEKPFNMRRFHQLLTEHIGATQP
jgi:two-component system, OmpR family, phosphate regulon response regulator PhoB